MAKRERKKEKSSYMKKTLFVPYCCNESQISSDESTHTSYDYAFDVSQFNHSQVTFQPTCLSSLPSLPFCVSSCLDG